MSAAISCQSGLTYYISIIVALIMKCRHWNSINSSRLLSIYHRCNFHEPDLSTEMTYLISKHESNLHGGDLYQNAIALQVYIHI